MNKAELVTAVAKKTGLSKKDCEQAVNATFDAITETLVAGEKVQLVGFGAFPQTKEEIEIPATRVASFKIGKALKDAVAK